MENEKELNRELQNHLELIQEKMPEIKENYKVKNMAVFGSYIHRNHDKNSDLDLLVEFRQNPTLFQFIRLENYLTDLLGVKVDLVMRDALKPKIGKRVLEEAQPL